MSEKETESWQSAAPEHEPLPAVEETPQPEGDLLEGDVLEGDVLEAENPDSQLDEVAEAQVEPPEDAAVEASQSGHSRPFGGATVVASPPKAVRAQSVAQSGLEQLPQRRWRLAAPRTYLPTLLAALLAGAIPFVAWWVGRIPPQMLWVILIPMAVAWFLFLPRPIFLALDERGVALIRKGLLRTSYLWIPEGRLARLTKERGWLRAIGTDIEQQGDTDWIRMAKQAGATSIDQVSQTFSRFDAGGTLLAAPIYLLDELSRDEVELLIYREGKS